MKKLVFLAMIFVVTLSAPSQTEAKTVYKNRFLAGAGLRYINEGITAGPEFEYISRIKGVFELNFRGGVYLPSADSGRTYSQFMVGASWRPFERCSLKSFEKDLHVSPYLSGRLGIDYIISNEFDDVFEYRLGTMPEAGLGVSFIIKKSFMIDIYAGAAASFRAASKGDEDIIDNILFVPGGHLSIGFNF